MPGADEYHAAALARLGDAQVLLDAHRWSGAAYMAGRAAEAMLRALLRLKTKENESGHDLRGLLKSVDRTGIFTHRDDDKLVDRINNVSKLWHNNLRFADDEAFLGQIKEQKLDRGIAGDVARFWSRKLVEACEAVVHRGKIAWDRSKKK